MVIIAIVIITIIGLIFFGLKIIGVANSQPFLWCGRLRSSPPMVVIDCIDSFTKLPGVGPIGPVGDVLTKLCGVTSLELWVVLQMCSSHPEPKL